MQPEESVMVASYNRCLRFTKKLIHSNQLVKNYWRTGTFFAADYYQLVNSGQRDANEYDAEFPYSRFLLRA